MPVKASDFVTTSEQKVAASERLLLTEQTDAVNTGLVDSADKRGISALKDRQFPTGRPSSPDGQASVAGQQTIPHGQMDSTLSPTADLKAQVRHHMGTAMGRQGVAAVAGSVVHSTLKDSELEGSDDLYYKARGVRAVYRSIRKRLGLNSEGSLKRSGDPLSNRNSLGGLSEKKYRKKPADPAAAKRKAQAAGYVKQRTYEAAAKNAAAAAAKTAASTSATAGFHGAAVGAGGGLKAVFAAIGGGLAPILGILALLLLFTILGGGAGAAASQSSTVSFGSLSGIQLEVAQALSEAGLGPVQIASVMGNIQGESGWDASAGSSHAAGGYGLFQFTGSTYTAYANWCNENGKQQDSVHDQTEYFIGRLQGSWSTVLHESGYYSDITEYVGEDTSYSAWNYSTDVAFATYAFMACYERPNSSVARDSLMNTRIPAAQSFYALLTGGAGGVGEDYANADETGKAIVNAALTTPSPGAGLCATWVSQVYQKAGLGWPTGNGNSMLAGYATSTDWVNIKVGQIVSAQYGSNTPAGNTYGHVGIYVGDGKIMDNIGSIRTISLTDWIAENGRGWVVYGWPW